jgi:hypothetical protein
MKHLSGQSIILHHDDVGNEYNHDFFAALSVFPFAASFSAASCSYKTVIRPEEDRHAERK